jgi:hypothetical protein
MNHSLISADRTTHLKILAVALLGAICIVTAGIAAHIAERPASDRLAAHAPVLKAGHPVAYTRDGTPVVR